ncbi:MAG: 23S rRNA (uracil1939-C5)-methyltransferase [Pseudohongiellaceae bacterium]|jgi:23S rRNA (uracil1939-C5)-methyltransferase
MANFFKSKINKLPRTSSDLSAQKTVRDNSQAKTADYLSVVRLSDDGRGIATYNNKTIFIENALPNEVVDVTINFEKSKFYEASAHTINQESIHRRKPQCLHFNACGGCHLQHLVIEEQQNYKLTNTLNKLKHVGRIVPKNILPTIEGGEYRYRQRVRLSVKATNNKILLGFRKKNSKVLVDINDCSVMTPALVPLIAWVRNWLNKYQPAVSHIELIDADEGAGLIIRHVSPISVGLRQKLNELFGATPIACWFQANKGDILTTIDGKPCQPQLSYRLDFLLGKTIKPLVYSYHPQDFIQANADVNQKMVNQAITLLQPKADDNYLDLFCGIGNFSLPLSLLVSFVLGVEGSKEMVSQATNNALTNHCNNVSFVEGDLFDAQIIEKLVKDDARVDAIDGIILDPPRAGAKLICQNIKKLSPKKILYISCDPNTFIRDSQYLIDNNYVLEHFGIMDMFAQTYHSEMMGLFVLKNNSYAKSSKRQMM